MMRPLDIELMERRPGSWAGWTLLALTLLFAADLAVSYAQIEQRLRERSIADAGSSRRAQGGSNRGSGGMLEKEANEAASVIDRLSLPWGRLFAVVEAASVERVALLSIQPDAAQRVVTLVGEAKQYDDVLAYVASLNSTPVLRHVHLASHEIRDSDPQRPVGFTVTAQWRAEGE